MELWGPLIDPGNENFPGLAAARPGLLRPYRCRPRIILSLVIGTLLGCARMMLGRLARLPLVGLIELLRGLPVVVTIYFVYLLLPDLGLDSPRCRATTSSGTGDRPDALQLA